MTYNTSSTDGDHHHPSVSNQIEPKDRDNDSQQQRQQQDPEVIPPSLRVVTTTSTPSAAAAAATSPQATTPRLNSVKNFESVMHLPSPAVTSSSAAGRGHTTTGDHIRPITAPHNIFDQIRQQQQQQQPSRRPVSAGQDLGLKIGKIRQSTMTDSPMLRITSEYTPQDVVVASLKNKSREQEESQQTQRQTQQNQLSSSQSSQKRNFSTPLNFTSGYNEKLEELQLQKTQAQAQDIDQDQDIDTDNELIRPTYTVTECNTNNRIVYKTLRKLGKGSFSIVLLGEKQDSYDDSKDKIVAIKVSTVSELELVRSRIETSMTRELEILTQLKHDKVIPILASSTIKTQESQMTIIVMPYCLGGDLYSFVSINRDDIKPWLLQRIFIQLVEAVQYLHHNDVVHRDLKLENVLLRYYHNELLALEPGLGVSAGQGAGVQSESDSMSMPVPGPRPGTGPGLIYLTDFGLSKKLDSPTQLLTTRCGSEDYVSPELMMGMPYDGKQNDVWALGVILYSLIEGRLPFDQPLISGGTSHISTASQRYRQTSAHRIALIDWDWVNYSKPGIMKDFDEWQNWKSIVSSCLVRKDKRINIDQMLAMCCAAA